MSPRMGRMGKRYTSGPCTHPHWHLNKMQIDQRREEVIHSPLHPEESGPENRCVVISASNSQR